VAIWIDISKGAVAALWFVQIAERLQLWLIVDEISYSTNKHTNGLLNLSS
jgi:hypothetical protein